MAPKLKYEISHEKSHTGQFEDGEYKYHMIKGILNSNPTLGKFSSSIQTL